MMMNAAHTHPHPLLHDDGKRRDAGLREKINLFCEKSDSSRNARIFHLIFSVIILLSVIMIGLETFDGPSAYQHLLGDSDFDPDESITYPGMPTAAVFEAMDIVFTVVFTIEFAVRMLAAERLWRRNHSRSVIPGTSIAKADIAMAVNYNLAHNGHGGAHTPFFRDPLNWVDLVAILPFYLERSLLSFYAEDDGIDLGMLRACRVLRIAKMTRHFDGVEILGIAIWRSCVPLLVPLFFLFVVSFVFGAIMVFLEPCFNVNECPFEDIFSASYFSMVTMTTVGYGDQIPTHPYSKTMAAIVMMFGTFFLSMPIAIVGNEFDGAWREHEERLLLEKQKRESDAAKAALKDRKGTCRGQQSGVETVVIRPNCSPVPFGDERETTATKAVKKGDMPVSHCRFALHDTYLVCGGALCLIENAIESLAESTLADYIGTCGSTLSTELEPFHRLEFLMGTATKHPLKAAAHAARALFDWRATTLTHKHIESRVHAPVKIDRLDDWTKVAGGGRFRYANVARIASMTGAIIENRISMTSDIAASAIIRRMSKNHHGDTPGPGRRKVLSGDDGPEKKGADEPSQRRRGFTGPRRFHASTRNVSRKASARMGSVVEDVTKKFKSSIRLVGLRKTVLAEMAKPAPEVAVVAQVKTAATKRFNSLESRAMQEILAAQHSDEFRDKLWLMLEVPSSSWAAMVYQRFIVACICVSIAVFAMEGTPEFMRRGESEVKCSQVVQQFCVGKNLDESMNPGCFVWDGSGTKFDEDGLPVPLKFGCSAGDCIGQDFNFGNLHREPLALSCGGAVRPFQDQASLWEEYDYFASRGFSLSSFGANDRYDVCYRPECFGQARGFALDLQSLWMPLETFLAVVYTAELAARVFCCRNFVKFFLDYVNWFDIAAIIPYYIEMSDALVHGVGLLDVDFTVSAVDEQWMIFIKLSKVLRVFKITRHYQGSMILVETFYRCWRKLLIPAFFLTLISISLAMLLYQAELESFDCTVGDESNEEPCFGVNVDALPPGRLYKVRVDDGELIFLPDIFEAWWLVMVTMTSVGYGGVYAKSMSGRLLAIIVMLMGSFYLAMPLTIVGGQFCECFREMKRADRKVEKALDRIRASGAGEESEEEAEAALNADDIAMVAHFSACTQSLEAKCSHKYANQLLDVSLSEVKDSDDSEQPKEEVRTAVRVHVLRRSLRKEFARLDRVFREMGSVIRRLDSHLCQAEIEAAQQLIDDEATELRAVPGVLRA